MNEQKIALITLLSCLLVVIGVLLFDDNQAQQTTQAILESEAVSELEFPSTLYQLPPVNKKEETTSVAELALNKVVIKVPVKAIEKEAEDHNTVSSPLPKKNPIKKVEQTKKHVVKKPQHTKTTQKGRYYVQIGAFKQLSGAKKKAAELSKANWRVKIVNRKGLRLLWIGPLKSRDHAKKIQSKLLKNRFTKGFIVKR